MVYLYQVNNTKKGDKKMKTYIMDKGEVLKLRLLSSITRLDEMRVINKDDEILNNYDALVETLIEDIQRKIMTDSENQMIVDFLTSRGVNEVSIDEMIEWCYDTGANTIEQVDKCGYDWDWWDKNGKLTYE